MDFDLGAPDGKTTLRTIAKSELTNGADLTFQLILAMLEVQGVTAERANTMHDPWNIHMSGGR